MPHMPTELLLDRPARLRDLRARVRVGALPTALTLLLVAWLLTFIAVPVVMVLARSVAARDGGITLAHFAAFFGKAYFLRSLTNTLILGTSVTALVMGLGFALAYLVTRGPRVLRGPCGP
jgi:iron(III) transport system permease protein